MKFKCGPRLVSNWEPLNKRLGIGSFLISFFSTRYYPLFFLSVPDHCLGLRCGETHWFVPRVWSPLEPWNEDVPEGLIAGPGPWDVDAESKHYRALNPVTYHRMGDPGDNSNSHERDMHSMRDPEDNTNSHERDMHIMRDPEDNSNFHERDMHSPDDYSNSHERDMSFLSNFEKTMNTSVDLNDIQALPDHALLAHAGYEQNASSPRKTADLELYSKSATNRDIRSRNALFGNDQWNQNGICQNKISPQSTIFQNETSPLRKVPPGLQDETSLQNEQRNLFRNNMPNKTTPSFSSVDSDEKMYRTNQNSLKRLKRASEHDDVESEHEDGQHYIPIRTLGSLTVDSIIPMREATSKLLATLYGTAFLCDLTTLLMYWNNLSPEDDLK